ncbi:MAG: DHH family phosphoesterase [Pseudomonadota bacterium]|nr:DHH family phosphoesterase [Pseudomonadota bacterium]
MSNIDVFNGDADGICALLQLQLHTPRSSKLVTGIKRDINLLDKVQACAGDRVTALDISLDKNREGLLRLLEAGAEVFYVDHHFAGEIPDHENLTALINTDTNTCTSLIIDEYLEGQYREWAVTGAFGDNLFQSAERAASALNISIDQMEELKKLGTYINYNGYGQSIDDLHFRPDDLFRSLQAYTSPFDFIADKSSAFGLLENGFLEDIEKARSTKAEYQTDDVAVYILDDEMWARRVTGVYSNELANQAPSRAHAVFTCNNRGGYQVSVRAPLENKTGADELCRQFPEGGGRKAAAGINHLEKEALPLFIDKFSKQYE